MDQYILNTFKFIFTLFCHLGYDKPMTKQKNHYALSFFESIMTFMIFFSATANSRHNKPHKNMNCLSFINSIQ